MELQHARYVLETCETYHCLPSTLYDEDAELMRLQEIVRLGTPRIERRPDADGEHY